MNTSQKPETPFLDEQGILITRRDTTFPGHQPIPWGSLGIVHFLRVRSPVVRLALRQLPFRLMVSTKNDPTQNCLFETRDPDLVNRINEAIRRAAVALG